ncbi:hypothetical protein PR003_g6426 [Phytophthora rubi]|nr:hypothetical protein PR002_g5251 [Phytophthora rubi]KAE9348419.1 hypothetical protein PR003_g6426 [Phytophthora rubi]
MRRFLQFDDMSVFGGDNCAVNNRLAHLLGVPLVGCASHRLNLAVRGFLVPYDEAFEQVQQLMRKLRTLKQAAKLRDLKAEDIEQVCLITEGDSLSHAINSVDSADTSLRPKSAEPKSAREERFAAQSWESLKASGNPIYETAGEFADVFPDKIPADLPADRPRALLEDCMTRQWSLPRDQVKAIDDLFEGPATSARVPRKLEFDLL